MKKLWRGASPPSSPVPGSANAIGGSWCAMKTMGRRIDDMVIHPNVGMKFALGENPKTVYHDRDETPITRMAVAALIREQLQKAKEYQKAKRKAKRENDDPPEYDAKCEALLPVLKGKCKAFFHCHRADDIFTAIRIAKEFSLDLVLVHATEGYLVADLLQQEQAKIIAGPVLCDRSKPEMGKASIENPAKLWQAGLPCAICTDHPVIPIQYLPLTAGIAIRGGSDPSTSPGRHHSRPCSARRIGRSGGQFGRGKRWRPGHQPG